MSHQDPNPFQQMEAMMSQMLNQMAMRVTQLEQQLQQDRERAQVERVQAAAAVAAAPAAAPAAGAADGANAREPRANLHVKFDPPKLNNAILADTTKTQLMAWIRKVENYILAATNQPASFTIDQFPVEEQRKLIVRISPFLNQRAADWYNQLVADRQVPETWAAFTEALQARFFPTSVRANTHLALMSARQKRGEKTHEYVARFDSLYHTLPVSERQEQFAITLFINGLLSEDTKRDLRFLLTSGNEKGRTLAACSQFAVDTELIASPNTSQNQAPNRGAFASQTNARSHFSRFHNTNSASSASSSSQSTPMELGAMENTDEGDATGDESQADLAALQTRRSQMSDAQRRDHMEKGLCFYCHQQGHRARECPSKQKSKNK